METGFGIQDFTPQEPQDGSFRVYDPISFRALILRDQDTNVTFLAGDCFSIEEDIMARVRERLRDIAWLNLNHILPCASHVGTTPILFQSYVNIPCEALKYFGREDFFAENMAAAIRKAARAMAPSRLGAGASSAPNILYNRRSYDRDGNLVMSNFKLPYPRPELTYDEVDDNVYVLRIDDLDGNPIRCAIVFGCHALCNTDKYGHVSADYPGVARHVVEAAGLSTLFLPGSIGNVVPVSRAGRTYKRVGHSVGGAALYALEQARTYGSGNFGVSQKTIRLPKFSYGDPDSVETELKSTPQRSDGLQRFQAYGSRHYATGRRTLDYTITRVSASGVEIVHLPGEIFVETASAIKSAARAPLTIVLSGPTADVGYLSTPRAHREGGMEPRYAGLAVEGERLVRAAAREMVAG